MNNKLVLSSLIVFIIFSSNCLSQNSNQKIDYKGFQALTKEVYEYRETKRVTIELFNLLAKGENTIILDCRSKKAYDEIHIKGAKHLNFSDFTEKSLAKVIPDKQTRVLIYCNNNFISKNQMMLLKSPPLALNIPTFINLYGYGYKNIYELSSYLDENDPRIEFTRKGK